MTRKEVAAILGVSERTVNNYAQNGRLNVTYLPGKTSPVADFDPTQVAALQVELAPVAEIETAKVEVGSSNFEPRTLKSEVGISNLEDERALALPASNFEVPTSDFGFRGVVAIEAAHLPGFAQALIDALAVSHMAAPSELAAKIGITVSEAHVLTGLSEKMLRAAIKEGELPARRIGRSLRLRPSDVRAWFDRQFVNDSAGDNST